MQEEKRHLLLMHILPFSEPVAVKVVNLCFPSWWPLCQITCFLLKSFGSLDVPVMMECVLLNP